MKVLSKSKEYIDLLFDTKEIEVTGIPFIDMGYFLASALDLAEQNGIDIEKYVGKAKFAAEYGNFVIMRLNSDLYEYSEDYSTYSQKFINDASNYARQYMQGTLKTQNIKKEVNSKYILLTTTDISNFKHVLKGIRVNTIASLFRQGNVYTLVSRADKLKINDMTAGEFVSISYCNDIQLELRTRSIEPIAKGNAIAVIRKFY